MSNKIGNVDISDILNDFNNDDNYIKDEVEYSERDFMGSDESEDEYLEEESNEDDEEYYEESEKYYEKSEKYNEKSELYKERYEKSELYKERYEKSENYKESQEKKEQKYISESESFKKSDSISEYNHEFRMNEYTEEEVLSSDRSDNVEINTKKNYLSSDINVKKYYDTIKSEIKTDKILLEIEKDILNNNYENLLVKLRKGVNIYKKENRSIGSLCNGTCKKNHNVGDTIESFLKRLKINPRKQESCYKNGLYYGIKNNIRGVKSIYNLLLKLLNIKHIFRMKCKCCIDKTETEYLEYLEKNILNIKIEANDASINYNNEKFLLELNFLINKFMSKIGLLKCECSYKDKYYEFYNENYHNYFTILKIYNLTIPRILVGLKALYKIKENMNELILIKESRCIHKDIINYKNFYYCKKKKYQQLSDEKKQIMDIIMNIEIIHNWIRTNNKIIRTLFNEQSYNFTEYMINLLENSDYEKEIDEKKSIINTFFDIAYKKDFLIIDIEYESERRNIVNVVIDNPNLDYEYEKIIVDLFLMNKNFEKKNTKLVNYISECFKREKYKLGLEFINHLDNLDKEDVIKEMENEKDNKLNLRNLLEKLLESILNNYEIDINFKISYVKMLYKKKIGIIRYDIISKLIETEGGDKLIEIFDKNDNLLINYRAIDSPEYVIKLIKGCIINKKVKILDYILSNFDNQIKKFNLIKNTINAYSIYFNTLNILDSINDINSKESNINLFNEVEYTYLLEVICKYEYNINDAYQNGISYLEYCIIKNYNNSAKILLNNNINLFKIIKKDGTNMIDQSIKSLLFLCVDNKNHIVCGYIVNKNNKIINLKYNKMTILNYIINSELEESVILKFLDKILINNIDINYQDENNINIPYEIINSSKINYENKIIFFNKIKNVDPMLLHNKIPLIMYTMLKDFYEITEILLNNLVNNKRIMKINDNKVLKDIETNNYELYYHTNENFNINFIPFIIKYIKEHKSDREVFRDYKERNKFHNIREYTIYENEYNMNILCIIILEFATFFIIHSKRNKIVIENTIIRNRRISDILDNDSETEKNKYLEITDGESNRERYKKNIYNFKNIILDTESVRTVNSTIQPRVNSSKLKTDTVDIWNKNTMFMSENTNISSEIEESDIEF